MSLDRHSPTAQAAYHDLLRLLLDDRTSDLRGMPTRVERNGRIYWYDSFRIGTDVRKTYIGEETPDLLVRILRAERLMSQDAATRCPPLMHF